MTKESDNELFTYICDDCVDDWVTNEEEVLCIQCLGTNIRKIED